MNVKNGDKNPWKTASMQWASISTPEDMGTFQAAVQNVINGYYDGIGYVFHDTGIVGIDIDTGYEDGLLSLTATDIITHCRSYTEKSRSGRGFHIFLRGQLPFTGRNNHAGVEIYRTGRYFITTGNMRFYDSIESNQEAIDYVVEKYFTPKATAYLPSMQKQYTPIWQDITGPVIRLEPDYPVIGEGSRNQSLASLAGQHRMAGYTPEQCLEHLRMLNKQICDPPLPDDEILTIVKSISRYNR